MQYNWQQPDWPQFRYDPHVFQSMLYDYAENNGFVKGLLKEQPDAVHREAMMLFMVNEALKTSEIEGE